MKNLNRSDLKNIIGGLKIENSCGYTGQFYVWCKNVVQVDNGIGSATIVDCWQGCVSVLTDGCSTTNNVDCLNQVGN